MQKVETDQKIADLESEKTQMQSKVNELQGKIDGVSNIINSDNSNNDENILLYNGTKMSKEVGIQLLDFSEIELNDDSRKKYNTTYYNYENGKYQGESIGKFGEEIVYDNYSLVKNVKKIAMSQKYNAIPREYKVIKELPEQLIDMADCTTVDINEIDLDGNGKNEYLVCYTVNYPKGEIGNGEPKASSGIMLFDNNYKKINDLVILENGFWANIKEEDRKIFLALDNVEYIDIDKDGIMEIIIEVPTYDGTKISILKYSNNKVEGETNLKASVLP